MEIERREALCRHLSESESSLEMEEERHYNEVASQRHRTLSSPVPYNPSPSSSRPLSPGGFLGWCVKDVQILGECETLLILHLHMWQELLL